jgi:hypothetical protein
VRKQELRRGAVIRDGLVLALLLLVVGLCAFHPLYAIDFFWHLELGEQIARTGSIPRTDLFSAVAPDRPYVQFNWLWELAAAELVRGFGFRGVRWMQAFAMASSIAALFALARAHTKRAELAFFAAALGFVWFEDRFQERPASLVLAFTVALFALVLRREPGRVWQLGLLGLLGAIWSNLHGGESLLLPLTWLALVAGECIDRFAFQRQGTRERWMLLGFCIALGSLLVSPTFVPGVLSWAGTIGEQVQTGNEEWQPAYTMLAQGLRPAFVIIGLGPTIVAGVWLFEHWLRYRREGTRALDGSELCLCAGYLALAHQAVRNVVLCIVPLLFLLGRAGTSRVQRTAFAVAAAGLVAIAAEDSLVYSYASGPGLADVLQFDLAPEAFPEAVAEFANEAGLRGGVINDGRWGGYLIWRLWPRCHVFADSRHHFTPQMWPVFHATHDALRRAAGLEQAFEQYGTELAIFRGPTFPLGAPDHFRLLFKFGDQEIYQDARGRHAQPNLERTRQWFAKRGVPDSVEASRKFGAKAYLASRYPMLVASKARRELESGDAVVRGSAHYTLGTLFYRAGEYDEAAKELAIASRERPSDSAIAYLAAQTTFARGDYAAAAPQLSALLQRAALSARQRRRLEAMRRVATQTTSATTPLGYR